MSKKQLHKLWRKEFNEKVFARDRNKCVFCDSIGPLDAHHITDRHLMPNGGYVLSNGITVCEEHHLKCEEYHSTNTCEPQYHPYELYKLINSSPEKAHADSEKLDPDYEKEQS